MKIAHEVRVGNIIMISGKPFIVVKTDFYCSGRNASVVKMKLKDLFTQLLTENTYRSDDKFEVIILDKKECIYSYFSEPNYVFMDSEYMSHEIHKKDISENILCYLEDGSNCELVFYEDMPISIDLIGYVVREISYTEPAVRGDSTGKVMKTAQLKTGHNILVPLFCDIGDKVEIDPRTHEFRRRVNK